MENEQKFTYQYSAKQNTEIESIRSKYLPKEENKLEMLKKMDQRVQNAGMLQGLILGILGCLVFGVGMCFGLGVFNAPFWPAYLFGALGVCMMAPAYPLAKHISESTRAEMGPRILELTDELMGKGKL